MKSIKQMVEMNPLKKPKDFISQLILRSAYVERKPKTVTMAHKLQLILTVMPKEDEDPWFVPTNIESKLGAWWSADVISNAQVGLYESMLASFSAECVARGMNPERIEQAYQRIVQQQLTDVGVD